VTLRGSAAFAAWLALLAGIPPVIAADYVAVERAGEVEVMDDDRARESERAGRLSRARIEHEEKLAQKGARLDAELTREQETARLGATISAAGRRESYLNHERYWLQREVDALPRDPADLSRMARRGAFERELRDLTTEQGAVGALRQNALRQFDSLRLR
jgi:hypothetical protein